MDREHAPRAVPTPLAKQPHAVRRPHAGRREAAERRFPARRVAWWQMARNLLRSESLDRCDQVGHGDLLPRVDKVLAGTIGMRTWSQ